MALQSVDSGRLVLMGATGALLAVAIARTASHWSDPKVAIVFGLYIGFGELLRLSLPGGRIAAPIAMSAALAYAMTVTIAGNTNYHLARPLQVTVVTATGMVIGALPHIAAGRPAGLTGMATRLLAVSFVAAIFNVISSHLLRNSQLIGAHRDLAAELAVLAVLATLGWLIETVIGAIIRADDLRARYLVTLSDELSVQWRLGLAVGVSVMITVLGAAVMGLWEIAVFAAPLLVIQLAFRRYAGIRATYLQTVRALAQTTEVGGYVEHGHSRRVTVLALAIGRHLGMPESYLLDLEYAALMHDIGQLALVEPILGGATVLVPAAAARRIAELGAQVIRQTGVLDTVADLVRDQWLPFRGGPREPPLGSRIVRATNAFDDLVAGSADRERIASALARLRSDTPVEYDPAVVDALATVVARLPRSRLS
jgi:hypothetical protein